MSRNRGTVVAIALLGAALAAAGCGLGPGEGLGDVELKVTRDYGARPLIDAVEAVTESDTVMRVLERNADISTRYGGGFVQSIEGTEAEQSAGRSSDWFFYVNGVESSVGAAAYSLHGGESIWWDYRDWTAAMRVPAVVGSWPQPFADGYDGRRRQTSVVCLGGASACDLVRERLEKAGIDVAAGAPSDAIRVLVGPWARVRDDPAAAQIEAGPQVSGVFADFVREGKSFELHALDRTGTVARSYGRASGLVAATRRFDAPPVWIVSGVGEGGVLQAARLLNQASLRDHYSVATAAGKETALPLP